MLALLAFAHWDLGKIEWSDALRSGAVEVRGSSALARELPTWNCHLDTVYPQPAPTPATAPA